MASGEPDRFWDSVGGGVTSREMRKLAADRGQLSWPTAPAILGDAGGTVTGSPSVGHRGPSSDPPPPPGLGTGTRVPPVF